jgi:hypothetical protein
MRTSSALLAAAVLLALGATAAAAAPARAAKLTPAEAKWVSPVVALWNAMNAGLLVVGDQTTASNALVPGSAANKKLVVTLANFIACTPVMTKAKAPPSARLKPFATSMKAACTRLGTGAHGVANGVSTIYNKKNGKLASLQIKAAFQEFQKGSAKLATARKQLLAAGGKGIFG